MTPSFSEVQFSWVKKLDDMVQTSVLKFTSTVAL